MHILETEKILKFNIYRVTALVDNGEWKRSNPNYDAIQPHSHVFCILWCKASLTNISEHVSAVCSLVMSHHRIYGYWSSHFFQLSFTTVQSCAALKISYESVFETGIEEVVMVVLFTFMFCWVRHNILLRSVWDKMKCIQLEECLSVNVCDSTMSGIVPNEEQVWFCA